MNPYLSRLHWTVEQQLGINIRKLWHSIPRLVAYLHQAMIHREQFGVPFHLKPCVHDGVQQGGAASDEYFWQDLTVARLIHEAKPTKHVDIGSRVDGFVAHIASFRNVEVFDVRPINDAVPGITFRQMDITSRQQLDALLNTGDGYCDSLSCLHVVEHFGLGRYGDAIDPAGPQKGLENLVRLLKPKGKLYISTPVGRERVEFNANWVFSAPKFLEMATSQHLMLERFMTFTPTKGFVLVKDEDMASTLTELSKKHYTLCLAVFCKELHL